MLEYIHDMFLILLVPFVIVLGVIVLGILVRLALKRSNKEDCDNNIKSKHLLDTKIAWLSDIALVTTYSNIIAINTVKMSTNAAQYTQFIWVVTIIPIAFASAFASTFRGLEILKVGSLNLALLLLYNILF